MKKALTPLLSVRDLGVSFSMHEGTLRAVRGVSFDLQEGKTLGLVGESGCGKSVTAFSILRLINPPGRIVSGSVRYRGEDVLTQNDEGLRRIRGREIAMIFQEPMTSLNPVLTVGYQIGESVMLHGGVGKKEARERGVEMLKLVGIPNPSKRYDSYPHEFSGGMRQRVMIAMSLSASPSVLIADEPTTALDVTIQAQILDLLLTLQEERRMSLLLITHDLGIVANSADHVAIMYAGAIAEFGPTKEIFTNRLHPYTQGLFDAVPRIGGRGGKLKTIPGSVPALFREPEGCVFYPRCYKASEECAAAPVELRKIRKGHYARCVKA